MTRAEMSRRDVLGGLTGAVAAAALAPGSLALGPKETAMSGARGPAEYVARDYSGLIGTPGFSEALLKQHFTLYQGYVKNTNGIWANLAELGQAGKFATPAAVEQRRRLGWEFNGMRLHELYFENMGGKAPFDKESRIGKAILESFGSFEAWAVDFKAVGAMRGIGWAALVSDPWTKRLFNIWINEHDVGHFGACPILLIMDVFEHAFITDFGLKRADYIEAFFKTIHWENVEKRF